MQKLIWLLLLQILGACTNLSVHKKTAAYGEVTTYGIYRTVAEYGYTVQPVIISAIAKQTAFELVEQTQRVPLLPGIQFGFDYRFFGLPEDKKGTLSLKWLVQHPMLQRPDGVRSDHYSYFRQFEVKDGQAQGGSTLSLTQDYELVPGTWVLSYWHNNTLLVKQSFEVYKP